MLKPLCNFYYLRAIFKFPSFFHTSSPLLLLLASPQSAPLPTLPHSVEVCNCILLLQCDGQRRFRCELASCWSIVLHSKKLPGTHRGTQDPPKSSLDPRFDRESRFWCWYVTTCDERVVNVSSIIVQRALIEAQGAISSFVPNACAIAHPDASLVAGASTEPLFAAR